MTATQWTLTTITALLALIVVIKLVWKKSTAHPVRKSAKGTWLPSLNDVKTWMKNKAKWYVGGITLAILTIFFTIYIVKNWNEVGSGGFLLSWTMIVIFIILIVSLIGWLCGWWKWGHGFTFKPDRLKLFGVAICLRWIFAAIGKHDKLGTAVFSGYYYVLQDIAIFLVIIGAILLPLMFADNLDNIPIQRIVRRTIGLVMVLMMIYMLVDRFYPEFFDRLPEFWYEGDILAFITAFGIWILVGALLFLCLFKKTRTGAATVLGFLLAGYFLYKMSSPSQPTIATPVRPAKIEANYIVSNDKVDRIPWPDDLWYNVREIDFGPNGRRPTPLLGWVQNQPPTEKDRSYRIDVSDPLDVKESREPLWIIADSDQKGEWQVKMLYWHR